MEKKTHLENVLMQQSYGSKSNMPEARPVAELLVALNEFNRYELYTGTGDGVQPLFGEGAGTPNVSFDVTQPDAAKISGKFVYFDYDDPLFSGGCSGETTCSLRRTNLLTRS